MFRPRPPDLGVPFTALRSALADDAPDKCDLPASHELSLADSWCLSSLLLGNYIVNSLTSY